MCNQPLNEYLYMYVCACVCMRASGLSVGTDKVQDYRTAGYKRRAEAFNSIRLAPQYYLRFTCSSYGTSICIAHTLT